MDDKAGFSQDTEDQYGNISRSDSSASGVVLSAAMGPQWKLGKSKNTMLYAQGGLGLMVESSRSIGNCTNCREEDIDIDSGVFARLGVLQNTSNAGAFGMNLTRYLSGDQKFGVALLWSTRL